MAKIFKRNRDRLALLILFAIFMGPILVSWALLMGPKDFHPETTSNQVNKEVSISDRYPTLDALSSRKSGYQCPWIEWRNKHVVLVPYLYSMPSKIGAFYTAPLDNYESNYLPAHRASP